MRRHLMPEMKEGGVNVTPLIDIVMCLIIFFMLVAKIGVTTGADPTINIPVSELGQAIKEMGNTLTLTIRPLPGGDRPQITTIVQGRPDTEIALQDPTGRNPLRDLLTALRKGNPQLSIIIRGDADMPYSVLEPVLITCAEANVKNVNFNTKQEQRQVATP